MTVYNALKNNEDEADIILAFEKANFNHSDIFLIMSAGKQLYQDFVNHIPQKPLFKRVK